MRQPILQSRLPAMPWADPRLSRLPGILPLEPDEHWLCVDEAFAGQMALRDALIRARPADVHALLPEAGVPAQELLDLILGRIAQQPGYSQPGPGQIRRPDGVVVVIDRNAPLLTAGRLVQEDLCILCAGDDEHRLSGAVLCFPASWTLAQKIGRPLTAIHVPVDSYDAGLARRVQRLFDAIRPEQPLWRMNHLIYDDPTLFQPRREGENRPAPRERLYIRCERQCLLRLPVSRAVVFSIHTWLVRIADLPQDARAVLLAGH